MSDSFHELKDEWDGFPDKSQEMTDIAFKKIRIFVGGDFKRCDALIHDGRLHFPLDFVPLDAACIDGSDMCIVPGLADVHVHLREPGFSYKETILTGTKAAAKGGYTLVCPMPNLDPVPDSLENLHEELKIIKKDAVIHTIPYGAITWGEKGTELSDMEAMAPFCVGFSDDGRGLNAQELMKAAMIKARKLDRIIAAHCEDTILSDGGCINDCDYARKHRIRGISNESEYVPLMRDIELAKMTGASYHVCHVSTKESVQAIRKARKNGVDISAETAPHYLLLDDTMLMDSGRFKMNPPLRSPADRQALTEAILDGTIDMIATDHAPHSPAEKNAGLRGSRMGVVGLECAFPVLYTGLVEKGILELKDLVNLMAVNPRVRFKIKNTGDFSVFDLVETFSIDPGEFISKGKSTPFEGIKVRGKCLMTSCNGRMVWQDPVFFGENVCEII